MKRFLKATISLFLLFVLIVAFAFGGMALYMRLYGNDHIKRALSGMVGSRVDFTSAALNLEKQAASFKGFSVASPIGFDGKIFEAEVFTVNLNKERLEKEKVIAFDSIYMKGAKLFIVRDKRGGLNLALPQMEEARLRPSGWDLVGTAYAAQDPSTNSLYDILKAFRRLTIEDSTIIFEDHYGMQKPYTIWCDRCYMDITASDTGAGYLTTTAEASLRLPQKTYGDGWFGIKASIAVYPHKTNMELQAGCGNVDLRIFQPYFQRNTPFYFRSGRFGAHTDLRMHDGIMDSLTTMEISDLGLVINPHDPNASFLRVSIDRLAPYLRSGQSLIFDFTMTGSPRRPEFGVGPRVKYAMGMVMMEEVGKAIAQIQQLTQ